MTGTLPARVFSMIAGVIVLSGCLSSDNDSDVALEPLVPLQAGKFSSHEDVLLLMPTSLYDRTYASVHTLIALPNIEPVFVSCDSGSVDSQRLRHNRWSPFTLTNVEFDIGKSWLRNCLNYGNDAIFGNSEMHGYREIGYARNLDSNSYYGYEISGEDGKPFIARTNFFSHQRFYDGDIEVIIEPNDDDEFAEDNVSGRVKLYDLTQFASHGTVFHSQLGKPNHPLEFEYSRSTNAEGDEIVTEHYDGDVGAVFRRTKSSPSCTHGLVHAETVQDILSREWLDDDDVEMVMTREIVSGSLHLTDANQVTAEVEFDGTTITVTFLGEVEEFTYQEYADLVMSQCLGF